MNIVILVGSNVEAEVIGDLKAVGLVVKEPV